MSVSYGVAKEELLGPAYVAMVAALKTYDPAKGRVSTHLIRAMQWRIREHYLLNDKGCTRISATGKWYKKDYTEYQSLKPLPPSPLELAEQAELLAQERAELQSRLSKLKPNESAALILRTKGLKLHEIATSEDQTREAVRLRVKRARERAEI